MPYTKKATATKTDGKEFKKKPAGGAVQKGVDPRTVGNGEGSSGPAFLKIDPNSYVDCTILVNAEDIFSVENCAIWLEKGSGSNNISPSWVYIGEDDPSHDLGEESGIQRRYKAYLPVLSEGEGKLFPMSKKTHEEIMEMSDFNDDELKGLNIRIKRTGAALQTRYAIMSKGSRTDVDDQPEVDVLAALGPLDREGIEKLLCKRLNASSFEEIVRRYAGKKITRPLPKAEPDEEEEGGDEEEPVAKKPAKKAAKKATPVKKAAVEPEDEDDEDLEF